MKRVACWACNETGRVHVEQIDRPFEEIPTSDVCLCCEGKGHFEVREDTISLIERAPDWFTDRQWRRRRYDRAAWAARGAAASTPGTAA
jgi:hypothetical protein